MSHERVGLLDSIFHYRDVLPTVDHRRLLELVRGFDWPAVDNPPPNAYYDLHGLRAQVGTITFPIIKENVDKILLVSEEMIVNSMYMIWQRLKIIIEPSCSIVLAALMLNSKKFLNKRVGLILTGGNYDLKQIPW